MTAFDECPAELQVAIEEFWQEPEWVNAASIARLESGWNAFALNDSTDDEHPCGAYLRTQGGVKISAERSVGFFQINSCNYPDWEWQRLYNARHNAGTAHMLWADAGGKWTPWYFSCGSLGLC
jgi:hypothetical protein